MRRKEVLQLLARDGGGDVVNKQPPQRLRRRLGLRRRHLQRCRAVRGAQCELQRCGRVGARVVRRARLTQRAAEHRCAQRCEARRVRARHSGECEHARSVYDWPVVEFKCSHVVVEPMAHHDRSAAQQLHESLHNLCARRGRRLHTHHTSRGCAAALLCGACNLKSCLVHARPLQRTFICSTVMPCRSVLASSTSPSGRTSVLSTTAPPWSTTVTLTRQRCEAEVTHISQSTANRHGDADRSGSNLHSGAVMVWVPRVGSVVAGHTLEDVGAPGLPCPAVVQVRERRILVLVNRVHLRPANEAPHAIGAAPRHLLAHALLVEGQVGCRDELLQGLAIGGSALMKALEPLQPLLQRHAHTCVEVCRLVCVT